MEQKEIVSNSVDVQTSIDVLRFKVSEQRASVKRKIENHLLRLKLYKQRKKTLSKANKDLHTISRAFDKNKVLSESQSAHLVKIKAVLDEDYKDSIKESKTEQMESKNNDAVHN